MSTINHIPEFRHITPIQTTKIPQAHSHSHSHSHSRKTSIQSIRTPASPLDPLSGALASAQARYTLSNGQSLKAHNGACENFPGGNTRTVLHSSPFPLTFINGKGCELETLDGDTYIDFLGEFTAGLFGHSNKVIEAAVLEALQTGWNYGGPNLYERKLAQKITQRFAGSGIELVRFTNSGTEANTMAIAAAVAFTGRKKVLVFQNGYHGGTLTFPSPLNVINTNLPHDFIIAPYNDIPTTKSIISHLPRETLAAILVEPIQGSGGCVVGKPEFLRYLNKVAHDVGALFIVDEVMTSRLSYHGLSSSLGLTPDLVTLGKWVGGGMTFGAFGGRKDGVMTLFDPRNGALSHSGTFNNNIITMAAGCAGLDVYTEEEVVRLNSVGERIKAGVEGILTAANISAPSLPKQERLVKNTKDLNDSNISSPSTSSTDELKLDALCIQNPQPGMWTSGQGSMLNIHFSGEGEKSLRLLFWHHMLESGIHIAQRGFIALNLELKEVHITKFLQAVDNFVGKYKQALTT